MKIPKLFKFNQPDAKPAGAVPQPQPVELVESVIIGKSKDGRVHWQVKGMAPFDAQKYLPVLQHFLLQEVLKQDDHQNQEHK